MNMLKFKLYYYSWFWLGRFIAPQRVNNGTIDGFADHFLFNLRWASFFGIDWVFLGDSNCEFAKDRETSLKWKPYIVVNIGKAGSRFDHWNEFFLTEKGQLIFSYIQKAIVNLGGNHVVQHSMNNLESEYLKFIKTFEDVDTIYINIPPLHTRFFPDVKTTKVNVVKANKILFKYTGDRLIDVFTPLLDRNTGESYFGFLGDPIHFNNWSDQVFRLPLIKYKINQIK